MYSKGQKAATTAVSRARARTDLKSLVACNIYVSAGGDIYHHRPILTRALQRAQELVQKQVLASSNPNDAAIKSAWNDNAPVGTLVQAYTDPVYNRSNFYLAGTSNVIASVASDFVVSTIQDLKSSLTLTHNKYDPATVSYNAVAQHPSIGIIDHVRVMPLYNEIGHALEFCDEARDAWTPAGRTAKRIAQAMREQLHMTVYLYGMAHSDRRSLADVRKKHLRSFKRLAGMLPSKATAPRQHAVTIGAPEYYSEAFHVLLSRECGKPRAKYLTRHVRESEPGGLSNVEALTLAYSEGRFEIACNFLRPHDSNKAHEVRTMLEKYLKKYSKATEPLIERFYHVGPTAAQCVEALRYVSQSDEKRKHHDMQVATQFATCFEE